MERLSLTDKGREEQNESSSSYGTYHQPSPRSSSFSRWKSWKRLKQSRTSREVEGENENLPNPGINVIGEDTGSYTSTYYDAIRQVRRCPAFPKCTCTAICTQRIPKGRAFVLILVMLVIERYILYGAVDAVLDLVLPELPNGKGSESFLRLFLFYCVSRLFYPIGGFIADVYIGRCRVIHMSLWLYWIAFALLTIACVLRELEAPYITVFYIYVLPIFSFGFVILASGGFESTLIPFGADQLEAASSSEISSYFYWYYLAIQIGVLLNIFVGLGLSMWLPEHAQLMQVFVTILVATCGLVIHSNLQHWYFKNSLRENCIKLVFSVLWYAARVKRQMPQYRRAFRYGEGRIKRINLAKQKYDGIFTSDQVEDVKTFCLICFVLFCLGGYFFSQSGVRILCYR